MAIQFVFSVSLYWEVTVVWFTLCTKENMRGGDVMTGDREGPLKNEQ